MKDADVILIYCSNQGLLHIQRLKKQKLSAPEEGQNLPPMANSQTGVKKNWPALIGKKYFACFGAESFFLPLYLSGKCYTHNLDQ